MIVSSFLLSFKLVPEQTTTFLSFSQLNFTYKREAHTIEEICNNKSQFGYNSNSQKIFLKEKIKIANILALVKKKNLKLSKYLN